MLVSFIGSPCSGKTTTAALLFAQLKEQGTACEFITEQARSYIAELRIKQGLLPQERIKLTDSDQVAIMERQLNLDAAFRYSVGEDGLVIADSSPLNALLYMTEHTRNTEQVKKLTAQAVQLTDLVFYTPALESFFGFDPNRVHTFAESEAIAQSIYPILNGSCPEIFSKVVPLKGSPQTRQSLAMRTVLMAKLYGNP